MVTTDEKKMNSGGLFIESLALFSLDSCDTSGPPSDVYGSDRHVGPLADLDYLLKLLSNL